MKNCLILVPVAAQVFLNGCATWVDKHYEQASPSTQVTDLPFSVDVSVVPTEHELHIPFLYLKVTSAQPYRLRVVVSASDKPTGAVQLENVDLSAAGNRTRSSYSFTAEHGGVLLVFEEESTLAYDDYGDIRESPHYEALWESDELPIDFEKSKALVLDVVMRHEGQAMTTKYVFKASLEKSRAWLIEMYSYAT